MPTKNRVIKIVLLSIGLYLVVVLGRDLLGLYRARDRVGRAEGKLVELKLENELLQEKVEKVASEEFKEKEVRDKLNLQKEGELTLVLPELEDFSVRDGEIEDVGERSNWEKWWRLFAHEK